MTDIIDRDHLKLYVGDDMTLRNEILFIYEDQLEHWLTCFAPTMSDDDWYHASHTLKGGSRGVGVWPIGDLCEKGEGLVGKLEDKISQRQLMLDELRTLVASVLNEISQITTDEAA